MPSTALLFESKLVTFCSPTLLKMKAGNIFNISNESIIRRVFKLLQPTMQSKRNIHFDYS